MRTFYVWAREVVKWLCCFPLPRQEKRFGAGRRRLDPDRLAQATELLRSGQSVRQVSMATGLHRSTVSRLSGERSPQAIARGLVVRAAKRAFRTNGELREKLVQSHLDSMAKNEATRRLAISQAEDRLGEVSIARKGKRLGPGEKARQ